MKKLYREETAKAMENFIVTGRPFSARLAHRLAMVKIATAKANEATGILSKPICEAICLAAEEVIRHDHDDNIVVDMIQGGAGTSINMNVNEIIASRAEEILGDGTTVHSLDHVNLSQSTNDVIPTAMKIATIQLVDRLIESYEKYASGMEQKSKEFKDILKTGRTHLQDAVPITLGLEFGAHAACARKDMERLKRTIPGLLEVNLGGTAVGTGVNATRAYQAHAIAYLSKRTGYNLVPAENLVYATQYADSFMEVSTMLIVIAANLIKCMNDLRLLASGPEAGLGEISFAPMQKGSSIMPGKINPVLAETINQICFQIIGNSQATLMAVQAGQLELNVMLPIVAKNLFESLNSLANGLRVFAEKALPSLKANKERCQELLERSSVLAAAFTPKLGYDKSAELVKEAKQQHKTFKQLVLEKNIMSEKEFSCLLDEKCLRNFDEQHHMPIPLWSPDQQPIYDIKKTYEENFANGPFFSGSIPERTKAPCEQWYDFLGFKVASRIGVPAGPLLNSNWTTLAARMGFDIVTYKTIRSGVHPCHPLPNMIYVDTHGELNKHRLNETLTEQKSTPQNLAELSVTNSFGVPSQDPLYVLEDIKKANNALEEGQIMIVSAMGSHGKGDFIEDYARAAALAKDAGAKIIEINFSCPNVATGEGSIYNDPNTVYTITRRVVKEINETPLIIKVGYFTEQKNLEEVLIAAARAGARAVCGINTIGMKIVNSEGKPALGETRLTSGVCGSPIKKGALEFVRHARSVIDAEKLGLTLIGVGGITLPEHFDEFFNAGADIAM
ncbi:MAG: aspartate ammonia-lyase, partial [Candidatus Babeliales bacterium]